MSARTHDVTINGEDYMVLPGTYRSYPDGNLHVDSRLMRQTLRNFTAGHAGPNPNAGSVPSSAVYGEASVGAWPAPWPLGVNAVGPAPAVTTTSLDLGGVPEQHVRVGGDLFFAVGKQLWRYRPADDTLVLRRTMDHPITGLTAAGTFIYVAFGSAATVGWWVDATSTWNGNAFAAITRLWSIGLRMVGAGPADNTIRMFYTNLTSDVTSIDGPVINATIHDDAIILATERSIWAYRPTSNTTHEWRHWGVVSSDGRQSHDDFIWMATFQGRLMTWQGGRAVVYDQQRGWWRHAGLEGAESYSAATVNGWLIVAIRPRGRAITQLWGYNGSGWWLMAEGDYRYLAAASGSRLLAFEAGSGVIHYFTIDGARDETGSDIAPEFTLDSAIIDGDAPHMSKFWTRIGVELARADPASVGSWDVRFSCSLDAGATWTVAGDWQTVDSPTASLTALVGAESAHLRVRIELVQDHGLPPHIMAIWAEYELLNDIVRRRRWQFRVASSDRVIDRGGALAGQDDVRSDLWTLFDGPASFPFTDVDGQEHTVRLIGLREEWQRPADVAKVGAHTTFEVVLVEL